MKIIDKTPFLTEKGEISLLDRIRGTLQYGFSWYPELQAQQAVIARLEKPLEKNYILIRNHMLGTTGIVIPMILVGPTGLYVLYTTHLRGVYRAKGDSWGTVDGTRFQPASINLLARVSRLGRALQAYLKRQGYEAAIKVEVVLLAANPGMHIEAVRPVIRVVMSDALERFAVSIAQAEQVFSPETVHDLVDHILHPRAPKPVQTAETPAPEPVKPGTPIQEPATFETLPSVTPASQPRDKEIPDWNIEDIRFAFEDEESQAEAGAYVEKPSTEEVIPASGPPEILPRQEQRKGFLGMSGKQVALLAAIFIIEICIIVIFFGLIILYPILF